MRKVLIIEDDLSVCDMLQDFLEDEQYEIKIAHNGSEALKLLGQEKYDLAIMDWELPDLAGPEIIKSLRDNGSGLRILMLTGRSDIEDKTHGLDCGADDYLTKPFQLNVLGARLRALQRRSENVMDSHLKFGDLILDRDLKVVSFQERILALKPIEYSLLEFFMRNPNRVFTMEQLLDSVWKTDSTSAESAVRTSVSRLRQQISEGKVGQPTILSVRGYGYKFTVLEVNQK